MIKQILKQISDLLAKKERIIVAIDGYSNGGKTTLASRIAESFEDCVVIHVDDFYLPKNSVKKNTINDGNIDYDRLKSEVVDKLSEEAFEYHIFSCEKQDFIGKTILKHPRLIVVEGAYSLHPCLGNYYDLSIFIEIDEKTQIGRLKKRNKANIDEFINKWFVLERNYFSFYHIKNKASIVIKGTNF